MNKSKNIFIVLGVIAVTLLLALGLFLDKDNDYVQEDTKESTIY